MKSYLAKLGDFKFEIDGLGYETLKRKLSFSFQKNDLLSDFPNHQAMGRWDESIDLDGSIILKKRDQVNQLLEMAKKKRPQLFVTGYGEIFGKFLIKDIDLKQSYFIQNGLYLRQDFSISMERYHGK